MILESTTYPGTTEELLCPLVEKAGFEIGKDFFIVYSPEREDPGNKDFTMKTVPKVISGISQKCLQNGIKLYEKIIDEVLLANPDKVTQFKSGKDKLFGFFIGQIMKISNGKANPNSVNKILTEKLKS